MKNKAVELKASGKFVGDLPVKIVQEQRVTITNGRRESVTPRIVVCPPMEEVNENIPAPRGGKLLRALSRRLTRRSGDSDSLDSSSSSESMSCEPSRPEENSSSSASDSGSDGSGRRRNRSTVSLRRVFQSLNLTSRSQSCSPTDKQRQSKKQQQPKRILRPPVTYTYVRGLSGLPTQRVPRPVAYCASSGLNR